MEPGALYVQRQPSGKLAFVRRPRRVKTPGALLADALFNPRSVSQKQIPYQVPDHSRFEPPSSPKPQQLSVPPYQQFQQYPHPLQYPLQYPLASFPNDMRGCSNQNEEESSPELRGRRVLVIVPNCCSGTCAIQRSPTRCHSCDCRGRRRSRDCTERRGRCYYSSEDSDLDSSSERDIPVRKKSHKHRNKGKGKGRRKSSTKKSGKEIYDSSDEEGEKRWVYIREPMPSVRPDANLVGSGRYDSRSGTVHFADRTDGTVPRHPAPPTNGNTYVNEPGYPIQQNSANSPVYNNLVDPPRQNQYDQYVQPQPPGGRAAIPIYQAPPPRAPEGVPQTYYDNNSRIHESNPRPGVESLGRVRRYYDNDAGGGHARSRTIPPDASYYPPRDSQYRNDNRGYSTEERGRSSQREYDYIRYPYPADSRRYYDPPRSPNRHMRRQHSPFRERSYSRLRPAQNVHADPPRVVEMRQVRPHQRHSELDPPTRSKHVRHAK
ncbi:hypothetical protein EMCG_02669 [[Emmonsia] crescens]|uniref:Uncharacterized protein n=1 Tax=[Emmonsia] crescens TaxID=73230 RepID=A0A0G2J171_9EURO|nr:hypothetical protein EMCG_02669 [Emmonsia crescens UAMH 3008]